MALLTLTSDIGLKDFLVGAIKGQFLQTLPGAQLQDITHEIPPFNYPQAAYICRNAFKYFPEDTFHILLINLFHQPPDHLLLARHNNQYFACADNGLLTMILEEKPEQVVAIPLDAAEPRTLLHCTGIMANVIHLISHGRPLSDFGDTDFPLVEKLPLRPTTGENYIEGQIIFIDRFENVVVNITRENFEQQRRGRPFKITFKRDEVIESISESYANVDEGEKLAFFNTAGYLEIAMNKGNAAGLFGLQGFSDQAQNPFLQNKLFYQTIRIFFE